MPKTETGEFELVLGNRQLLSGFAVVAILFGVFFAMGYIVGRNSTPSAHLQASDTALPVSAGNQPDPGRGQTPTASAAAAPSSAEAPVEAKAEEKLEAPPEKVEAEPASEAARQPEPVKRVAKGAEAVPLVQSSELLQPGTYLQVMAIKKLDADVIAKALQGKGFPTLMTPSSLEGIFRVLVGPYKDATSLGRAKTELENSGFHPIVQKIADRS